MKVLPLEAYSELLNFMDELFKGIEMPQNLPLPLQQLINRAIQLNAMPVFQGVYLFDVPSLSALLTVQATFSYLWAIRSNEIIGKCADIVSKYHLGEDGTTNKESSEESQAM